MTTTYRADLLEDVLAGLCQGTEGIEQVVIVSVEGFVVASHSSASVEGAESGRLGQTIAAMAANAIGLGTRTLERLECGNLERLIVEGKTGAMIIQPIVAANAALAVIVRKDAKVGLASSAMRLSAVTISAILSRGTETLA